MANKIRLNHIFNFLQVTADFTVIECRFCGLQSDVDNNHKLSKQRCKERERQEKEMQLLSYGY